MIKKQTLKSVIGLVGIAFIFSTFTACTSSKKVNNDFLYFQRGLDSMGTIQQKENVIKTNDVLSIQISSKSTNQEQAALFNIPNGSATLSGYQVSSSGTIELPILGAVKASGLTKVQLQSLLTERLSSYVKDPLVIIKFLQFNVNVLGEVRSPGTKTFVSDRVSIIDAISASGDLTDFGKKDNAMVIREENGKRNYYTLDLRSGSAFQSPAYLLQPNDIVYVEPNNLRIKNVNRDPHQQENSRLWLSFTSIGVTIATLIITLIRTQ